MTRPQASTSGAMRLWVGMVALCGIAAVQIFFLSRLEPDQVAPSRPVRVVKVADGGDEALLSGGGLFPALGHLVAKSQGMGESGGGGGKPGVNVGSSRKNGLEVQAERIKQRLSSDLDRVQGGDVDGAALDGVQRDLGRAEEIAEGLQREASHAEVAEQASKLISSASAVVSTERPQAGLRRKEGAVGGVDGWLGRFRMLFEKGRLKGGGGADVVLDVLLRLLEIVDGTFVEFSGSAAEGEGGHGGRDGVPLVQSPFAFLREHRQWQGVTLGPFRRKDGDELKDRHMRQRCREAPYHSMCREALTAEGIVPLLAQKHVGKDVDVIGALLGTVDFFLVAALLRGGFKSKIAVVAYNRNFGVQEAYAVLPEGSDGWSSDCYYGASSLAWQRLMKRYDYTVVGGDSDGALLLFVRNELLPRDAHAPTLWTSHWLQQAVPERGPLFASCDRMSWISVPESAAGHGKAWEPAAADHVVLRERIVGGGLPGGAGVYYASRAADDFGGKREWAVDKDEGACRDEDAKEQTLVHSGSLLRMVGSDGIARWKNQEGNAMLMKEAKRRRENHVEVTENMTAWGGVTAREWFAHNWHESVSCGVHARVGDAFVCDPHRMSNCGCLVYSFEDGGDRAFEEAVLRHSPHCTVHVFDNTPHSTDALPNPGMIVHRTAREGSEGQTRPLRIVRKLLGHQGMRLDLLRVRLKGAEFDLIEGAAADGSLPGIAAQILIKVHFPLREGGSVAERVQQQRRDKVEKREAELETLHDQVLLLRDRVMGLVNQQEGDAVGGEELQEELKQIAEVERRISEVTQEYEGMDQDRTANPGAVKLARLAKLLHGSGYAVFSKVPDLSALADQPLSVEYSLVHRDYLPAH